jgi:hypothetical protein
MVLFLGKTKKKHKTVAESSESGKDPNSVYISDAETESGNASRENFSDKVSVILNIIRK